MTARLDGSPLRPVLGFQPTVPMDDRSVFVYATQCAPVYYSSQSRCVPGSGTGGRVVIVFDVSRSCQMVF